MKPSRAALRFARVHPDLRPDAIDVFRTMVRRGIHRLYRPAPIRTPEQAVTVVRNIGADVVSFDFFDTIAYRRVEKPSDIFELQYRDLRGRGTPLDISSAEWVILRQAAERDLCLASACNETDLDAIYAEIGRRLGMPDELVSTLRDAELHREALELKPYPGVIAAIEALAQAGKTIAVTTDTYLPEQFILDLLRRWTSVPLALFCSSVTRQPKRTGAAFAFLSRQFPGKSILHFGDNYVSDVVRAQPSPVKAKWVVWDRQIWMGAERRWLEYRRALGVLTFSTPLDGPGSDAERAKQTLAWRWAAVLADFASGCLANADARGATDIWFLSRDCELMFAVLQELKLLPDRINCRYVFASRAACYPVLAKTDPAVFARLVGRPAAPEDVEAGERAVEYLNGLLRPGSRRVMIVDVGWVGRMHKAMRAALPEDIELIGYYLSLTKATPATVRSASQTFVEWDQSVLSQAVIEALMGYEGDACVGYVRDSGGQLAPAFRDARADRAPALYRSSLRQYLTEVLAEMPPGVSGRDLAGLRLSAVRAICHLPDEATLAAFSDWTVGVAVGSDAVSSLVPSRGNLLKRLVGYADETNVWPAGGIYHLVGAGLLRASIIRLFFVRELAKAHLKRIARANRHILQRASRSSPNLTIRAGCGADAPSPASRGT